MAKEKKKRIERLKAKYRLIVINDSSLQEVFSYKLNRLNFATLIGISSIVIISIFYLIIAYTPLKEYVIPDYPKLEEQQKVMENALRTDSLENKLRMYDRQMSILKIILNGGDPPQYVEESADSSAVLSDGYVGPSSLDSMLRMEIEEHEELNLNYDSDDILNQKYSEMSFTPPLRGIISSHFNSKEGHFATDIVAEKGKLIHSVLPGTVILATWTVETGYIIIVQHDNDFISQYKHNSKLLKQVGDRVQAGDGIAIIGNSGEITTGPHLHFELWNEGRPVNSEEYIVY